MRHVVIENPVINSPFEEPTRHFRFDEHGITDEIVEARRPSAYFIPVPPPKKQKGTQQVTFESWTGERMRENDFTNAIRVQVRLWRQNDPAGLAVTPVTRRLLQYWTNPEREKKFFFCQIEAIETAIYITEVAKKLGHAWVENGLREANAAYNPGLYRICLKMATGAGKTVVMAMLIAWQALNKSANPQDARFTDSFLIVTPGITIRDRLRVLLPNDPSNYYRERDVLPPDLLRELEKAKIVITNFHAFLLREKMSTSKLHKTVLGDEEGSAFRETPDDMVRRVCRDLGNKKNIIVINDEAHHCYRSKTNGDDDKLNRDEQKEAERRNEQAHVWISGLEAIKRRIGIRTVYDLSATPFFLRGSGYGENTLFPWVVSDFSLVDAIECGIVKVPRVPVADDAVSGEQPTYRELWVRIRDDLPRTNRKDAGVEGEPKLPAELQSALHSLYDNYDKYFKRWQESLGTQSGTATPPVFIVVCANTAVSRLMYNYIAGWEKTLADGSTVLVPGHLPLFSNVENNRWLARPNTILVDSEELESGEALSPEFRKIAAHQIEEFKNEYRARFPGRDVESLTDADVLREVMNTVGKPGKLGEAVRCVVSVAMLSEGWDASTVTHILGVRAFGTQLLCEQVVGRGLRRMNYVANDKGMFEPEYAEVYGVPFSFIPCSGSNPNPKPVAPPVRVRALPERIACEITFPRVAAYRYDFASERLAARFSEDSRLVLSTEQVPTWTENAPIVGESVILTLEDLKQRRMQEVEFLLAKLVLEKYFRADGTQRPERTAEHRYDSEVKAWLFPQVLSITREWLKKCLQFKDNAFPQMLLLLEFAHDAADRIYASIISSVEGQKTLKPILKPYDPVGSTRYVDFNTTRPTYATDPQKCHVSHVVADTQSWEQKMAQVLEEMDEVISYVKNQGLGFYIPYTINGEERNYMPDFIAKIDDGHGREDPLNLIIEVSGERDREKAAKAMTTRTLWVPSVNNHGAFGRWGYLEISDPWDAKNTIRAAIRSGSETVGRN